MKTNAKAVLRALKNSDGEYPVVVRVTINRVQKFLPIKETVTKEQWSQEMGLVKRDHPYFQAINDKINALIKNINDFAYSHTSLSATDLFNEFNKKPIIPIVEPPGEKADFFRYAKLFMERYQNSPATFDAYKSSLMVLEKFLGRRDITWPEITRMLMSDFYRHLITENYSTGTQKKIFTHIKNIFNTASIELEGVYKFNTLPFVGIKFSKTTTSKTKLNEVEIKMIRKVSDPRVAVAKDVFLFGWNLGGMRISDLCTMKWSQISGDHLTYKMRKTQQTRMLELSFEAKEIIARYRTGGEYVFPLLRQGDKRDMFLQIRQATTIMNRKLQLLSELAELRKKLTTHVSRHSWTNIALEKGADIRDVQGVLGHTALSTTEHYVAGMDNSAISKTNLRIVQ